MKMDKLQMAHDYLLKIMSNSPLVDQTDIEFAVSTAWSYARMMHSEKIKEDKAEAEQKRKEVREILNDANTFIEREGQHFDDVHGCEVDWSQAPEWAVAWTMDSGETLWWSYKPELKNGYWFIEDSVVWQCADAPSFGFTGSHIVERPHGF